MEWKREQLGGSLLLSYCVGRMVIEFLDPVIIEHTFQLMIKKDDPDIQIRDYKARVQT